MIDSLYTRKTLQQQPVDFRIGAIISDGMWYPIPKWRKAAKVTEEELIEWIERHLANGMLVESDNVANSYRFPKESVEQWYEENVGGMLPEGKQLLEFTLPVHLWGGKTEVEWFDTAPLREVGIFTFTADPDVASEVVDRLRNIARVREISPGKYKCYCLEATYVKAIVEEVLTANGVNSTSKKHVRSVSMRREMADLDPEFAKRLVLYYRDFSKVLVRNFLDTISIFLPEPADQDSQVVTWVLEAIEKFDEKESVPFPGYLYLVLRRWPYDLPKEHLGEQLADFQRQRAKALKVLKTESDRQDFSSHEMAAQMGIPYSQFIALENNHKVWLSSRNAATLTWAENNEDKEGRDLVTGLTPTTAPSDIELSHRLSMAAIRAAVETNLFDDAFALIAQIDANDINMATIEGISQEYITALGIEMGLEKSDV